MKIACVASLTVLLLLLVGCATPQTNPGTYRDWEGELDSVEIIERFHLSAYQRILVLPVDARALTRSANQNTQSSIDGIVADATQHMAEQLQGKLPSKAHIKVEVAAANTSPKNNPGALLFKPRFALVDAGSETSRILTMGMAGQTKITLDGEFVDGGSGRLLARFSKTNKHGTGGPVAFIQLNSLNLEANEDEIVNSVGELLNAFFP